MRPSACSAAVGLIVLLAGGAAPAEEEDSRLEESSFEHRMAQGRFLLERGQIARARDEFLAAAQLDRGAKDPDVHELLARVQLQLGEVGGAVEAVRKARALAGAGASEELRSLHEQLTTSFGKVIVLGAGLPDARSPEPVSTLFDPELKRIFEAARARLRQADESGSTSVWLPVGSYSVGTHIIEVTARRVARMDLRPHVGEAGEGVYGEVGATSAGPPPPEPPRPGFVLRGGVHGFGQQEEGQLGGRLLAGVDLGAPERRAAVRFGFELAVQRAERVDGGDGAPAAMLPAFVGGAGPLFDLPGALRIGVSALGSVGVAVVLPGSLPAGYVGPTRYLAFGPDLELRFEVDPGGSARGRVEPEIAVRFLLRELRPLDPPAGQDQRPHLAVGGGVELGLRFGGEAS